jgi:curved DNA-binding protein
MSDHYSTLGIDRNASPDDIKKAYRKLAMKHHPDRNGGDDKKFKEIQTAYDTLSNPDKKAQYDNPSPFGTRADGGWQQAGFPPGFEDIFAQAFGGGNSPFGFHFREPPPKNKSLNMQASISLEEAFQGKDLLANVQLPSGRNQTIEVKIPRGIQSGTTLRLAGMGDDSLQNAPRGDINLTIHILPHAIFQRKDDDLILNIEVDAINAILGEIKNIKTIDNKTLELKIHPGTQPGQVYAAAGYGMPSMRDPRFVGRLLININIKIPTNLSEVQLSKLKEIYN